MCVAGGAVMVELQLRILRDSGDNAEYELGLANHPSMECITRLWRLKILW